MFTGCIWDKQICKQSGLYNVLETFKLQGYIKDGDCIMADKRFTIREDFAVEYSTDGFINISDVCSDNILTEKIAKHREHIERLIAKVKTYKMLSVHIPTSLLKI